MSSYGLIYVIENMTNGRKYVGQTTMGIKNRWASHVSASRRSVSGVPLYLSMRKHGIENFTISPIEEANSQAELDSLEASTINRLKSMVGDGGYNVREGGLGGRLSEETKRRMGDSRRGEKHFRFGKPQLPHVIEAVRKAHLGRKHSAEEIEKRRAHLFGRECKAETREKIAASKRGKKMSPHVMEALRRANRGKPSSRRVRVQDMETGVIFDSYHAAAQALGMSVTTVWNRTKNGNGLCVVKSDSIPTSART